MRIALIAHLRCPIREPFAGGVEKHTRLLATGLAARGHEVTLFAAPGSDDQLGYRVRGYDPPAPARPAEVTLQRDRLRATYRSICADVSAGDFDLVHDNSLHRVPWTWAWSPATPVVHVLQTPPLPEVTDALRGLRPGQRVCAIAVSEAMARAWGPHVRVSAVVPNGIRVDRWRYSSRPVPGLCAFVGRIVPDKGVHLALAAAHAADRQLLIAGPVAADHQAYFDAEIATRLDRRRRYVGHLNTLETSQLLSNAECLAFASVWDEPFGLAMVESLACGTPVVAFDRGAAREVLTPETGICVAAGDVGGFARAMDRATALDRRACRRLAAERYDVARVIDAYEDVYHGELARAGGRFATE